MLDCELIEDLEVVVDDEKKDWWWRGGGGRFIYVGHPEVWFGCSLHRVAA